MFGKMIMASFSIANFLTGCEFTACDRVMPGELHPLRGARGFSGTGVPYAPPAEARQWRVWRWMGPPKECLHGCTHIQAPYGGEEDPRHRYRSLPSLIQALYTNIVSQFRPCFQIHQRVHTLTLVTFLEFFNYLFTFM
jgi:hypothetical protein